MASARFSNGRSLLLVRPLLLSPSWLPDGLWCRFARCAGAVIFTGRLFNAEDFHAASSAFIFATRSALLRGRGRWFRLDPWTIVIEQHGRNGFIAARLFASTARRVRVQLVRPIEQGACEFSWLSRATKGMALPRSSSDGRTAVSRFMPSRG